MSRRGLASVEREGRTVILADTANAGPIRTPDRTSQSLMRTVYDAHGGQVFGWGIGPTVNCWLNDVPSDSRLGIVSAIPTTWERYRLTYIPGRALGITRPTWKEAGTTLYDLSNFSPGDANLPNVARSFGLDVPELVVRGDRYRRWEYPGWSPDDLSDYASQRAALIGQLADRILTGLERHGFKLHRPLGVGSLGSGLLRESPKRGGWFSRYRPDYQPVVDGQPMLDLMLAAYYGGRSEMSTHGTLTVPCWRLDLRSAYLWALAHVGPVGMIWEHTNDWTDDPDARMSLWRVSWRTPDAHMGPLPWRETSMGGTRYPPEGIGWYWWPEVRSARRVWGDAVTVHEGYISPRSGHRPLFDQATRLYRLRQGLESAGDPMVNLVKASGNAVYGRLAQQRSIGGHVGKDYNPALAGWICSAVRARLLDAIGQDRQDAPAVAAIMTDGYLTLREPAADIAGPHLGGWKVERFESATLVVPGMYRLHRADGTTTTAETRITDALDWDQLIADLTECGRTTIAARQFTPHILADLWPDQFDPTRCRWTETAIPIDPWHETSRGRRRSHAWTLLGLDWSRQLALTGIPFQTDPRQLSAPYRLPPAWSMTGYDAVHDAAESALKGIA